MKTYPYLVIDKDNMSKIEKVYKVEDIVNLLASKKKLHHCIVLKDENTVLKFPKFIKEELYTHKCYVIRDIINNSDSLIKTEV
jgi:hypothetical protein